jgi:hypothetical protein
MDAEGPRGSKRADKSLDVTLPVIAFISDVFSVGGRPHLGI